MRTHVNIVHRLGLHLLGSCVFLYFLGIVAGVVNGMANDRPIALNVSVGLICGSLCVYFLLPKTMPDWLRSPVNVTEAFAVLFALVVALIFLLGPMSGVAVAAFEPPATLIHRYMAAAMVPAGAVSALVTMSGFVLAFLPAPETGEEPEAEEKVQESAWEGIEKVALENDVPALNSVRMMRLSRT